MVLRKLPLEESLQVAEKSNWLKHLNSDKIVSLIRRFEAKEEIQQLIKEYDIRTYCGSLESILPPIVYEIKCPYCALHMQEKRSSNEGSPSCPKCKHEIFNPSCNCEECYEKYNAEKDNKKKKRFESIIRLLAEYCDRPFQECKLTLKQKFYLSALMRLGADEEVSYVELFNRNSLMRKKLTPSDNFTKLIMEELIDNGIILPDPKQSIDAFYKFDLDNNQKLSSTFDWNRARLLINVTPEDGDREALIKRLFFLDSALFLDEPEFCKKIKFEIELSECLLYLSLSLKDKMFSPKFGTKTNIIIEHLLNKFSVNEVYRIIDYSVKSIFELYPKINDDRVTEEVVMMCSEVGIKLNTDKVKLCDTAMKTPEETVIRQVFDNTIASKSDCCKKDIN